MLSLLHKVPPLGGCVSLQSEFKCLIFCVSRLESVRTRNGVLIQTNEGRKLIGRQMYEVSRVRVCAGADANLLSALWARVCVCVCASDWSRRRRSSAARVPSLMGLSGGMKGGDKRRGGGGKVKAGDGSLRREEHRSLDRTRKEAAEWRKIWLPKIRGAVAAV